MGKIGWIITIGVILLIILAAVAMMLPFGLRYFGGGALRPVGGLVFPFLVARGLGMLLFWLLIMVAVVWVFRALAGGGSTSTGAVVTAESPLDILKRRYARGEINKEQFDEMKNTLGG